MLVTHDAYAASFCRRTIFIKDGTLSTEIIVVAEHVKLSSKRFWMLLATIGGEVDDVI